MQLVNPVGVIFCVGRSDAAYFQRIILPDIRAGLGAHEVGIPFYRQNFRVGPAKKRVYLDGVSHFESTRSGWSGGLPGLFGGRCCGLLLDLGLKLTRL